MTRLDPLERFTCILERFACIGGVILGILLLLMIPEYLKILRTFNEGIAVEGTVVDVKIKGEKEPYSVSTIRFLTTDGQQKNIVKRDGVVFPVIGDVVEVFYLPEDPNGAVIKGFTYSHAGGIFIGFILIGVSVGWLCYRLFTLKKNSPIRHMANYYYTDASGQKRGPLGGTQLFL